MSKKVAEFRKPKKASKLTFWMGVLVVALFVGFFYYNGKSLREDNASLDRQLEEMSTRLAAEQARTLELQEFEVYTHTKKYAEEVAKDVLGYVYDGEIVFSPRD